MTGAAPATARRLGRYELIAEIASGGMGIVCLARAVGVGGFRRLFAIKVMHPHLVKDQQFVAMLLDEAQLAARIHHPNVVATVDICTVGDCYFLVMDYIDGFQLLDILEHPTIAREQRIRVSTRILLDAMAGLEAAHSLQSDEGSPVGLVHRDVSPQNILIGLDGIGRLTDFGIALAASRISASRPGTIKGKPAYMAPEQARALAVDRRADIWALGVILWEGLAGRRLFIGDTEAATVLKVIDQPIESPRAFDPALPESLAAVSLRALERDAARRPASAREMAGELERAASGAGLLADSHEVADCLRQMFGREIEQRRAMIRAHALAIGPNSSEMGPRDVYDLPSLAEPVKGDTLLSPTPQPPPATAGSARAALAATVLEAEKPKPRPRQAVNDPTLMEATAEVPRAKSGRRLGVLAFALIASSAALGFWLTSRNSVPSSASQPSASPPATASEKPPEILVTPVPASAPLAPEGAAPPSSAAPLPLAASPSASASPPTTVQGLSPRPTNAKRAASSSAKEPAAKTGAKGPVIEENPYGLR